MAFLDEFSVLFRYPSRSAPALLELPILPLMVVRRLVLFGLSGAFKVVLVVVLVLFACMMVLELNGLRGLAGLVKESD